MSLTDKIKKTFFVGLAALAVGCSLLSNESNKRSESPVQKINYPLWALPANIAAGYFGGVATHEGGHALVGVTQGIKIMDFNILPGYSKLDGSEKPFLYLGFTTFSGDLSNNERLIFDSAGVAASFLAGIGTRELLKTGCVPQELQPTLAWYALSNKALNYFQSVGGVIKRSEDNDLGRHNPSLACAFLGLQLAYDIYDIGFSDDKFFEVLIGDDFYRNKDKKFDISFESNGVESGIFFVKKF